MIKEKKYRFFYVIVLSLLANIKAIGQLQVDNTAPYDNAQYLVENVLLGSGVLASNFTFNGDPVQVGFFNGTGSNLGLDSGVVLSTDDIAELDPTYTGFGFFTGNSGHPDLLTVANSVPPLIGQTFTVSSVNDVAVLEFDFVPASDSVAFRYVFGSDEYPTFINSSGGYNDVFGFFISGPGITGPYANGAENIAIIPNTNPPLPITISSVHGGKPAGFFTPAIPPLNDQYYVDNPLNTTVNLDGFTTVITARAHVQCGETYHIALAIADGSDGAFTSAVFLEANSFSSGLVNVTSGTTNNAGNSSSDTLLYEGCNSVKLDFSRSGDLSNADTIKYILGGTATNGVDYTDIPPYVIFSPNVDSVSLTFIPIRDTDVEGVETIELTIPRDTNSCSTGKDAKVNLYISDIIDLKPITISDTLFCNDDSADISVSVLQGVPNYKYQWSTTATTDSIKVKPNITTKYLVTVTDGCNLSTAVDTAIVYVPSSPVVLDAKDYSISCPNEPVEIEVGVSGGEPPFTLYWDNGVQNSSLQTVTLDTTTTFTFYFTDNCDNNIDSAKTTVNVPEYPPLTLSSFNPDTVKCIGETVGFNPSASGGSGGYTFTWDNWLTTADSIVVTPLTTTNFIYGVTDNCPTDTIYDTVTVVVPIYAPLTVSINEPEITICLDSTAMLIAEGAGGSGGYTYNWNNFAGNTDTVLVSPLQSQTEFTVTIFDNCMDTATNRILVYVENPKAVFNHNVLPSGEVEFTNLSSQDAINFWWNFHDGNTSIEENHTHTYNIEGIIPTTLLVTSSVGCSDSTTKLITTPTTLWVPNAFTPNGDGKNDVLQIKGIGLTSYELQIFNRWGKLLFTGNDLSDSWDGTNKSNKVVENGSYIYKIEATGYNGKPIEKQGTVTLIR